MILRFCKIAQFAILCICATFYTAPLSAAPYGAVVMDARDGRVLYSRNGNKKLHPASLTKMMTLYIAFAEIEAGRISLETNVRISQNAAAQPPSKIGLRAGSTMKLKYLLRAAAIKSANDAAMAIGEAIGGSEANFARYMTSTAKLLGMRSTQFKNPHGLSTSGHYSTPMDMAILGRHIIYDYSRYYNLFSREYADTPLGKFRSSNVRFLRDYPGADGIKTGYTRAAGYNLVGTARRGSERVIVSMFGGQSSFQRNEQVGALLDLGFQKTNAKVKVSNISRPRLKGAGKVRVAVAKPTPVPAPKPVAVPAPVPTVTKIVTGSTKFGTIYAPDNALIPARRIASQLIVNVPTVTASIARSESRVQVVQGASEEMIAAPPSRPGSKSAAIKSTSANEGGGYSIQAGSFDAKSEADRFLIDVSLLASNQLSGSSNRVISSASNGRKIYRARFSGLSKRDAYNACAKIGSTKQKCYVLAPS